MIRRVIAPRPGKAEGSGGRLVYFLFFDFVTEFRELHIFSDAGDFSGDEEDGDGQSGGDGCHGKGADAHDGVKVREEEDG